MKMFRLLHSALLALLVGLVLVAVPAHASDEPPATTPTVTTSLPQRVITWEEKQKDWRTFLIKGKVQDLVDGKVLVQKKECRSCKWKTVRKVRTDERTRFRTKIFAPEKGKWFWRFQVNADATYARSRSIKIAMYLR